MSDEANRTAWMVYELFKSWFVSLDWKFKSANWNVLKFIDNVPAHMPNELTNINLVFLPPNTTSRLQAIDAGII